ncbi:MAG TPA: phosphocholine cytidylyltransferase family protein [Vicinamibacteria bacterium]|jgi:2-aminoethylphosphonate-pyruvate transaminase
MRTTIVLAAGQGRRLRGSWDLPKGLLRFGGETLIERSLRLLRGRGIERVVMVVGYQAALYRDLLGSAAGVELVANESYADSGSMASLARALEVVHEDFLLVEGDLAYEGRGLDALLAHHARNVLLASGPTGAGDEVWVDAPRGRVRRLSKDPAAVGERSGELVGLTRVSAELAGALAAAYDALVRQNGDERVAYDTDALSAVAGSHEIALCLVEDLVWGEVDDATHYARMRDRVWPRLAREGE